MKLTAKIVAIFMLGIILLTALHGYLTVRREDQRLTQEMDREAHSLGRAMEELRENGTTATEAHRPNAYPANRFAEEWDAWQG